MPQVKEASCALCVVALCDFFVANPAGRAVKWVMGIYPITVESLE